MCSTIYGSIQKDFWSFYMYLEVIFIIFCVHVYCLHCFLLFKHVLCRKTCIRVFSRLNWRLASRETPVVSSSRSFGDSLATRENFVTVPRDSPSCETPRNSFLKGFLGEICFKPLSSFLKPLFHYFYIKTQSIWMVFHSINISKVFLNSFRWFGYLDYVLESFVPLVGVFIMGVVKT